MIADIKACIFDVFGSVVDWRSSLIKDLSAFGAAKNITGVDWTEFSVAWRKMYQPAMEEVRSGRRPFTQLDTLHRESLYVLLDRFGIKGLTGVDIEHMNKVWHRLDPWPDSVMGLTLLKAKYIIAPCSNGNVALMVNMAKRAGLPWDCILGAEAARAYKPTPRAYLGSCELLNLMPHEVLMCAAHNGDLKAAKAQGLRTAFWPRPTEHGPGQTTDLAADPAAVDIPATDIIDLARKLGC